MDGNAWERDAGPNLIKLVALGFPKPRNTSCNQFGMALYVFPPAFIKSRIVSRVAVRQFQEKTQRIHTCIHTYINFGHTNLKPYTYTVPLKLFSFGRLLTSRFMVS